MSTISLTAYYAKADAEVTIVRRMLEALEALALFMPSSEPNTRQLNPFEAVPIPVVDASRAIKKIGTIGRRNALAVFLFSPNLLITEAIRVTGHSSIWIKPHRNRWVVPIHTLSVPTHTQLPWHELWWAGKGSGGLVNFTSRGPSPLALCSQSGSPYDIAAAAADEVAEYATTLVARRRA